MERVAELEKRLGKCIASLTYGDRRTRVASHLLADSIIKVIASESVATHTHAAVEQLVELMWKKCIYGPFDHLRKLSSPEHSGSTREMTDLLHECIGYQITLLGLMGGDKIVELLHSLNLKCTLSVSATCANSDKLISVNAVHLGDLFRYLLLYATSPAERVNYESAAFKCYEAACKWSPEYGLPWNQLGVLYSTKLTKKAIYCYVKALQSKEPFPTAIRNLETCLRNTADNEDAFISACKSVLIGKEKGGNAGTILNDCADEEYRFVAKFIRAI